MSTQRYIAAICPKCNTKQAYDKSEICPANVPVVLGKKEKQATFRCTVKCRKCGHQFVLENVDCEGFIE